MSGAGQTPANTTPHNDPTVPNLTWVYNGPDQTGQIGLGNFSAASTFNQSDFNSFTAQTHRQVDNHIDHNITDTQVPVPSIHDAFTPEPATLALAGLGLPLVGLTRWVRRRKA